MLPVQEIIILVLAALAMVVNTLGLVSVLRNYRRLRQRMYLFIISLTIVNVIVGISYTADVITKILTRSSAAYNDQPFCGNDGTIAIESLKSASVVLSSLNTLILTYALHKRTTRMGRHRAENTSTTSNHSDGSNTLHLPAFDTMMRVLSIGVSQQSNSEDTPKARKSEKEHSSGCESSLVGVAETLDSKAEFASAKEEEYFRLHANGFYRSQNGKSEKLRSKSLGNHQSEKRKKKNKIAQMLVSRGSVIARRGSHLNKSSQSYIGRHSLSVVSVRTTVTLLVVIWIIFVVMWLTPIFIRVQVASNRNDVLSPNPFICPPDCKNNAFQPYNEDTRKNSNDSYISFDSEKEHEVKNNTDNSKVRVRHNRKSRGNKVNQEAKIPLATISYKPKKNKTTFEMFLSNEKRKDWLLSCSTCSKFFYPISKVHVMADAAFFVITWLYLFCSSLRLRWLRKHSNNVFVRCSALWRFLLFTSVFYFIIYCPYVTLCVFDFVQKYSEPEIVATSLYMPNRSLLMEVTSSGYTSTTIYVDDVFSQVTAAAAAFVDSNTLNNKDILNNKWQTQCFIRSNEALYVTMSSSCILFHSAVAPLFYLMRLLGCRRILTVF